MALKYKRRLLDHMQHENYRPSTVSQLADDLNIDDEADLGQAVRELAGEGVVRVDGRGLVSLPSLGDRGGTVEGVFRRNPRGFGFVRPDEPVAEGELFIPARQTGDAASGDRVRAEVRLDRRRGGKGAGQSPFIGAIVEVLARKRTNFSGGIYKQGGLWLVQPDGRQVTDPIVVRDAPSKNVKDGDKVVVEMIEFPEGDQLGEGVIIKVLGDAGRPDVETQAVIYAHHLPEEFPDECIRQARDLTAYFEEEIESYRRAGSLDGREDLTGQFICTIDPPDAKDYDDAISIARTEGGGWRLGVHIADVGHFVQGGTPLDVEAAERGNSVYLPRLVIPMLPEVLSNGICSLQEGIERFAKSAIMTYNRAGEVVSQGFASTVIKSGKRLTYLEAQALIDGDETEARKHAKTEPRYTEELIRTLREMDALAKAIRARRQRQGMISLELPDVELIFDEQGHVIDAEPEDDAFTHTIIEMFMVEANEALARLFEQLHVPLLRRVHPAPTPGDTEDLRQVATVAGYRIPKNPTRQELQGLLDATRGTPVARAVHLAVLRTLTKAEYSPALIGHFALASEAYAHFTSPIRRYPDLTVHRALAEYLALTDNGQSPPQPGKKRKALGRKLLGTSAVPDEDELVRIGRHCTDTEENAEDAERELRQFLVLQLLQNHIGDVFRGVVTGVSPRGVYVQLDKFLADGMIKREDLPGDVTRGGRVPNWRMDARTGALVDQHSGRSFKMGDLLDVAIAAVDLTRRRMDLLVADPESRAAGKAKPVLKLGDGGLGRGAGAGFGDMRKTPGATRRSRKSKARDRGKTDHRRDRKKR